MTKILLLNPANTTDAYGAAKDMPPLGMLSVAAVLEREGFDVRVADLEFAQGDPVQIIRDERPAIVGIGGTSTTRFNAFTLARLVKQIDPAIKTVYGGCHATFTAHDTLRHVPEMDAVVRGEGEMVMLELARCVQAGGNWRQVLGLSYRTDGHVIDNEAMPRIRDLDALPPPARHLVNTNDYHLKLDLLGGKAASLITSRGCPINCSFCSASVMFGRLLTTRSAASVVDEMERLLAQENVAGFKFFDSTFTLSRRHAEAICDEIIRRGITALWECEIRVNTVDLPLLRKMKTAGCYLVDFGIESASSRMLERMHKGITLAQAENVLHWAHDLGIHQKVFFTFGHIEETEADAAETLDFIARNLNRIALPSINIGIRVYPGTEVEEYALARGYLSDFAWSQPYVGESNHLLGIASNIPIFVQPQMGLPELLRLKRRVFVLQAANPRFVWRRVSKAHSRADIAKYARLASRAARAAVRGGRTQR